MAHSRDHIQNLDLMEDDDMLDEAEAGEEIIEDDGDAAMDSDGPDDDDQNETLEEIQLQNDSVAHFDGHKDSIFCIARHPVHTSIVATGGGDDVGFIFESTPKGLPVASNAQGPVEREGLDAIYKADGHTDSINALTFTYPNGAYFLTAGLDGRLRAYRDTSPSHDARAWTFLAEAQEVEEINFLVPCPNPEHPNTVAMGASDGSVWVYTVDAADASSPLTIVQAFYLHTDACTAGAWTPDGRMLATVSQDGSFYVWDVFGDAAASGVVQPTGQSVVGLTAEDERFRVDGGLYSVAISPTGAFAAVGGAEGNVRIVGLPRLAASTNATPSGGKSRGGGARQSGATSRGGAADSASTGQAGVLLASLQTQSDSVETIAFAAPPLTLMATGSVDGSVAIFDAARRFAVRRKIEDVHEGEAVIKVQFGGPGGHFLLTCGNDGVVRRWDCRGGTAAAASGFAGEWKGHRGGGEGGGVMGFVVGEGGRLVTAGDE